MDEANKREIDQAKRELNSAKRELKLTAIVLAAGRSRRFGGDKRLHMVAGVSLLQLSLSKPLALNLPTILVLRPDDSDIISELVGNYIDDPKLSIIYAAEADLGMGHSLAYAFSGIDRFDAALVMLADMPWVQLATITEVINHAAPGKIVVPSYQGRKGHPILFTNKWFEFLTTLSGDAGAKVLLRANQKAIIDVPVNDEGILRDMDTME